MLIDFQKIPVFWYGGIKEQRKKNMLEAVERLGLNATHVEPIICNDPVNRVRIGCTLSHLKTLEMIKDIDEPVLVLEDDIRETEWYDTKIVIPDDTDGYYAGTCLNGIHPDWMLMGPNEGCCADPVMLEEHDHCYRIHGMLTTHAILYVSKRYKQNCYELLKRTNASKILDVLFASEMKNYKVYAHKEPLFYQDCQQDNYDAWIKTKTPLKVLFDSTVYKPFYNFGG